MCAMMRIFTHTQLIIPVIPLFCFCSGCISEPVPSFTADNTTITEGETVQFTDLSTNNPTDWLWTFNGATPSTSEDPDPKVSYMHEGKYSVTLEVRNRAGANVITRDKYISVSPPTTDLTFINNTCTEVLIDINGFVKTVSSGDEVTYYDLKGNSVTFNAETSGKTSQGDQIGVKLYWSYTISLNGGTEENELNVGSDYFFLYITNSGTHVLSPLEIDDGSAETHIEYIAIPTDGVKYNIGYYYAWEFTQVRAIYKDDPEYFPNR